MCLFTPCKDAITWRAEGFLVRFLAHARDFSLLQRVHTVSRIHQTSCSKHNRGLFCGRKSAEGESVQSPPSFAEGKE